MIDLKANYDTLVLYITATSMKSCITWALVGIILLATQGILAQKSHSDYKKELRSLNGTKYISLAFDGAKELANVGSYDESIDLMDRAVKKAKSLGNNPVTVIYLNKAKLIATQIPLEDKYVEEIIKSFKEIIKRDPPSSIVTDAMSLTHQLTPKVSVRAKVEIEKLSQSFKSMLTSDQQQLAAMQEEKKSNEYKKLDKKEAFLEIEQLKSERMRLEGLQVKLSETIQKSERQLNQRAALISKMSKDQANKEAILQFNLRMIDSLKFIAALDSFELVNQDRLIKEQESEIELQDSKLELQESTLQLQESELQLKSSQRKFFLMLSILGMLIAGLVSWMFLSTKKTNLALEEKNAEVEKEKERSEELLLNILPQFVADELKENHKVKTRMIKQCTVIFTDFIGFSAISKILSPQELIAALDECFRAFDNILVKHKIEKIKTIGDSYMCASGVPRTTKTHAIDAISAAFEMVAFLDEWNKKREKMGLVRFDARIGIHSGPIIAGVVGVTKFAYDIWGDTVNVASRIEGQSSAQKINISATTYELIKEHFQCSKRGSISVKNMDDLEMYFVDHPIEHAVLN